MSDQTYKQDIEVGDLQAAKGVTNPVVLVQGLHTRSLTFHKLVIASGVELADAAAATATAETRGIKIPGNFSGFVKGITLTTHAAVAGDAANGFTMTVTARDQNGLNPLVLGTISSVNAVPASGNFVAFASKPFTLTAANATVAAGGFITYSIAKNGTGVVVPTFDCEVNVLDQ